MWQHRKTSKLSGGVALSEVRVVYWTSLMGEPWTMAGVAKAVRVRFPFFKSATSGMMTLYHGPPISQIMALSFSTPKTPFGDRHTSS